PHGAAVRFQETADEHLRGEIVEAAVLELQDLVLGDLGRLGDVHDAERARLPLRLEPAAEFGLVVRVHSKPPPTGGALPAPSCNRGPGRIWAPSGRTRRMPSRPPRAHATARTSAPPGTAPRATADTACRRRRSASTRRRPGRTPCGRSRRTPDGTCR